MERFGQYVLLEPIGRGGMAEVFRAVVLGSAGFSKPAAIKRILPHLTQEPDVVAMLVSEAKLAAGLNHPNIVAIRDLGMEGGRYFIAMEYVPGRTLRQVAAAARTQGQRLPLPFCVHAVEQALLALAHAHGRQDADGNPRNIIHRDISPENVMVSFDGHVYLMDFGIAKAADHARLTEAGSLKGKPAYMSPELLRGQPVSQALDLYAMGVVLHELLAGRPMREPKSDLQMFADARKGTVPRFEQQGVDVPVPVAEVVYRALAFDPAARFPDASSFRAALLEAAAATGAAHDGKAAALLMRSLLFDEIAVEQAAQRRVQDVMDKVRNARGRKLARVLEQLQRPATSRRRRVRPSLVVSAVATGLLGVVALGLEAAEEPAMTPVVVSRPAPTPPAVPPRPRVMGVPVSSEPSGARVHLDGTEIGRTPLQLALTTGRAALVAVELQGHLPFHLAIAEGAIPASIHAVLPVVAPAPPPSRRRTVAQREGRLTLTSKPWGRIFLDGKDTGLFTPQKDLKVQAGTHSVAIINDQLGVSARFKVTVPAGGAVRESHSLRPD